jgi:SAM-dependent methyltransferase
MSAEFGTVAEWTAEVAADLGPEYFIPAACRGSGSPAGLIWLLQTLGVGTGDRLLDVGAGAGGPAAFAADRAGVLPVLVEPEPGACRAAYRLFGLPVVQAEAAALPFRSGSFDLAWCIGVLCTTADQAGLLAELRRVVGPGGRVGLLVYTAVVPDRRDQPEGNTFPTSDDLRTLLREADLAIETMAPAGAFAPASADWQRRASEVDAALKRRYGAAEAWRTAQRQSASFGLLLDAGTVVCTALVVRSG